MTHGPKCEHDWVNWGYQGGGFTPTDRVRWHWVCSFCNKSRTSSREPHTRSVEVVA